MVCPPIFTESPIVLIEQIHDFFPFSDAAKQCTTTALNSIVRFGILLGVALTAITMKPVYLIIIPLFGMVSAATYYGMTQKGSVREGFSSKNTNLVIGSEAANRTVSDVIGNAHFYQNSLDNPFGNLLINEISQTPLRDDAKDITNPKVKKELDSYFSTKVQVDPGDVYQRNQSQRQFVTLPSNGVPNDRHSLQNWLYRVPGKTCKEGNTIVCKAGTEGKQFPWLTAR